VELILVRHGLPVREVALTGVADPHLNELGRRQAIAVGDYLGEERVDAIWTSPMTRARETAQPLAECLGLVPVVHDGLAEWDREAGEYIPIEELKATNDPRWQAMQTGEWTGGIDPLKFQARVVGAIDEIVGAHPRQRVAVFCHAGVLGTYLAHILGISRPGGFFHPAYTSIHRVIASSSGHRTVQSLNELTHLYGKNLLPTESL
jgi:2,3-bisphosphoglycerate-dependent phosphoglycerate mutase